MSCKKTVALLLFFYLSKQGGKDMSNEYQPRTGRVIKDDGTIVNEAISAKQPFSGSTNQTITFASKMRGLVVSNDVLTDLSFTLNGATYTVKGGEVFEELFDPFTEVVITAQGEYR